MSKNKTFLFVYFILMEIFIPSTVFRIIYLWMFIMFLIFEMYVSSLDKKIKEKGMEVVDDV